jgi:protease I
MSAKLRGKRIAVLLTEGFEQVEMTSPREALEKAGATVELVSPAGEKIRAWDLTKWGKTFRVDTPLKKADPADYDALVLPGGVMNPDKLRLDKKAVDFVRSFFEAGKPVAAICHAPWTLIEADVVRGRRVTSWPSLRTDLLNAGADWVDEQVVVDDRLVTSRKPADLPAFNRKVIENFAGEISQREFVTVEGAPPLASSGAAYP